jgi:uncharacterized protein
MLLQVVGLAVAVMVGVIALEVAVVVFSPLVREPRQPIGEVGEFAGDREVVGGGVGEALEVRRAPQRMAAGARSFRDVAEVREVRFEVDGETVVGSLYLPVERPPVVPCVVLNNGLGGTREVVVDRFARRFATAGLGALTYDYRHFGASDGQPRHHLSLDGQVADARAAVAYVRSLAEVDADRVAVWGTSAGGGYGLVLAAADRRIACVVAQCAGLDHAADTKLVHRREGTGYFLRLLVHGQRDKGRAHFGLSPHRIPLVGPPGSTALLNAPGALEGYAGLAGRDFANEVCARVLLTRHGPTSGEIVADVRCPVLVQVCEQDVNVSVAGTLGVADRLGGLAEVVRYPIGHFDVYRGEWFERAVADQLAFFSRHLGSRSDGDAAETSRSDPVLT